jgi:hypothetical protein
MVHGCRLAFVWAPMKADAGGLDLDFARTSIANSDRTLTLACTEITSSRSRGRGFRCQS